MGFINRQRWTPPLTAALAAGLLCLPGCDGNDAGNGGNESAGNNNCKSAETCKSDSMPDGRVWMTENLNIQTADSWCYGNSPDSCAKYGRLYTWEAAKTACPNEWHLPSRDEWGVLAVAAGGTGLYGTGNGVEWNAGETLKSQTGWNRWERIISTDEFGFSALPGGNRNADGGFYFAGKYGYWWTATESGEQYAYGREIRYDGDLVNESGFYKKLGRSVRCVSDAQEYTEPPKYAVTVVSDGKGASKDSSYRAREIVAVKAGAAPDKMRFENWTVTSGGAVLADPYSPATTFIMPANAVEVKANFIDNTYTVTIFAGTGAQGGGEYYPGATVSVAAGTSPNGLPFMKWTASNRDAVFADPYDTATMFIMPSEPVTVNAKFAVSFTDVRDNQKYAAVTIGGMRWMAENLNYQVPNGNSFCSGNSAENCALYGSLYDWKTAMGGAKSSTAHPSGVRGVCPSGWHLPSLLEWGELARVAGGGDKGYGASGPAAKALKSTSGWYGDGNGTDEFGFSALPGGNGSGSGGSAGWWTATSGEVYSAFTREMRYDDDKMSVGNRQDGAHFSVRCVED